jgi:hypothetical protein
MLYRVSQKSLSTCARRVLHGAGSVGSRIHKTFQMTYVASVKSLWDVRPGTYCYRYCCAFTVISALNCARLPTGALGLLDHPVLTFCCTSYIDTHNVSDVRFEFLTAVFVKVQLLWNITACRCVNNFRRFEGLRCLHNQGQPVQQCFSRKDLPVITL